MSARIRIAVAGILGSIVALSLGGVSAAPPAQPVLALSVGIKIVELRWTPVAGAAAYRVYEAPDLASPFVQLGGDIPQGAPRGLNRPISVHRLRWDEVRYRVDACDASGSCSSSNTASPAGRSLSAIGYFKASNAAGGDELGGSVAISADGMTLAVGAFNQGGQGAVYVFTRSAVRWSEQALLKAPTPVAVGYFGSAVSISDDGNTLAVGAFGEGPYQRGSAYVFTRTGTTWSSGVQLLASNGEAHDNFGAALALSGDGNTLAVGALGEASNATGVGGNQLDNSAIISGAVYVFARSGTAWAQQAYVKASTGGALVAFGTAVALATDGNTLAVGGPGLPGVAGRADVLTRSGTTWTEQQFLVPSASAADDQFAVAVSVSGDGNLLAIGAPGESAGAGAAYLFRRAGTVWSQDTRLTASAADATDAFGYAIALGRGGGGLVVGAPREDGAGTGILGDPTSNTTTDSGAAYVFQPDASGAWVQTVYLKAPVADAEDSFGTSVAANNAGTTIAVGAPLEAGSATGIGTYTASNNSAPNAGAVYVY